MIKWAMRWSGYVAGIGESIGVDRVLVGKETTWKTQAWIGR